MRPHIGSSESKNDCSNSGFGATRVDLTGGCFFDYDEVRLSEAINSSSKPMSDPCQGPNEKPNVYKLFEDTQNQGNFLPFEDGSNFTRRSVAFSSQSQVRYHQRGSEPANHDSYCDKPLAVNLNGGKNEASIARNTLEIDHSSEHISSPLFDQNEEVRGLDIRNFNPKSNVNNNSASSSDNSPSLKESSTSLGDDSSDEALKDDSRQGPRRPYSSGAEFNHPSYQVKNKLEPESSDGFRPMSAACFDNSDPSDNELFDPRGNSNEYDEKVFDEFVETPSNSAYLEIDQEVRGQKLFDDCSVSRHDFSPETKCAQFKGGSFKTGDFGTELVNEGLEDVCTTSRSNNEALKSDNDYSNEDGEFLKFKSKFKSTSSSEDEDLQVKIDLSESQPKKKSKREELAFVALKVYINGDSDVKKIDCSDAKLKISSKVSSTSENGVDYKVAKVSEDVIVLTDKIHEMEEANNILTNKLVQKDKDLSALRETVSVSDKRIVCLEAKIKETEQRISRALQTAAEAIDTQKASEDNLFTIRLENKSLLDDLTSIRERYNGLVYHSEVAKKEFQKLNENLSKKKHEIEELESKVSNLQDEIANLRSETESLKMKIKDLSREVLPSAAAQSYSSKSKTQGNVKGRCKLDFGSVNLSYLEAQREYKAFKISKVEQTSLVIPPAMDDRVKLVRRYYERNAGFKSRFSMLDTFVNDPIRVQGSAITLRDRLGHSMQKYLDQCLQFGQSKSLSFEELGNSRRHIGPIQVLSMLHDCLTNTKDNDTQERILNDMRQEQCNYRVEMGLSKIPVIDNDAGNGPRRIVFRGASPSPEPLSLSEISKVSEMCKPPDYVRGSDETEKAFKKRISHQVKRLRQSLEQELIVMTEKLHDKDMEISRLDKTLREFEIEFETSGVVHDFYSHSTRRILLVVCTTILEYYNLQDIRELRALLLCSEKMSRLFPLIAEFLPRALSEAFEAQNLMPPCHNMSSGN